MPHVRILHLLGTATCILAGVAAMHMIKKQVDLQDQFVRNQKECIHQLFGSIA